MAAIMQPSLWQGHKLGHKHTQSVDSEISYFDASSSSTEASWSGYFEGWEGQSRDGYCPDIASYNSSPTRPRDKLSEPELLPTACPRPSRPTSLRRDAQLKPPADAWCKTKRYGIVSCASPSSGKRAAAQLDQLLQNSLSSTEDILAAMYNPEWDVVSLQKWYQQTPQGPSDLAMFKIMFSLRYSLDEPLPMGLTPFVT